MSSVEQRVVQMQFDNKTFESGVKTTQDSLAALNKSLQLEGATKGLDEVSSSISHFSLAGILSGVQNVSSKFTAMGIAGVAAIADIAKRAVDAGIEITKSLTIDPIKAGLENYETQINAIQTILANTSQEGTKLADVNKVLAVLNTYANQTVYNFSEMVQSIGTFTAAGVDLQTSANAIKGIANLAAISGSNSQQAATAMYQLSQAIAAGSVKLQDWNSVVNAGLGGKTFQTALENTARASGIAIDKIVKKAGSFRNSLQEGWLTSDVLTKTLSQFTGDLSKAQIEAMGFTSKEADNILILGKTAVDAATKIKTMTQLTSALKEEVATAYAAIFKTIFGDIGDATVLFSSIHTSVENAITGPIYALNTLLQAWVKLGGRADAIDGIKNALKAVGAILKPIKDAFREIFPPATAQELFDLTVAFDKFTKGLLISGSTADEIKRTFAGLFAIIDIGWTVLKDVAKVIVDLFSSATKGSGGFLKVTAGVGDFFVALDKAIKSGQGLTDFFDTLETDLEKPIALVRKLGDYIGKLFAGFDQFDPDKAAKDVTKVASALDPLELLGKTISEVWDHVIDAISAVWDVFEPIAKKLGQFFSSLGNLIMSSFGDINYQDVLSTFNTGLFAGLLLLLKKFVSKFHSADKDLSGGVFSSIKESLEGVTKTLKSMQSTLRATTLLEIAAALTLLTIAVVALSKIDSAGLTRALTAMTVMFTQLGAGLFALEKTMSDTKLAKLYLVTGALSLLAIAIDLLTISVKSLSGLKWDELAKGLAGTMGLLAALTITMKLMPSPVGMIGTASGLVILSAAIYLLTKSVTALDGLSWQEMAKGLSGVAALLLSLALFTKFAAADAGGISQGAGIALLALGIKLLASALKDFSQFSWQEIAKGVSTLAGALVGIALALKLMPPNTVLSAASILIVASSLGLIGDAIAKMGSFKGKTIAKGLSTLAGALFIIAGALDSLPSSSLLSAAAILIVAASLSIITDALQDMSKMSWKEIAKGLLVLAASLNIIAITMDVMTEALPGAAALLIVAASLAILAPILLLFGSMSWSEILKGLTTLAGVFVILGVAGLALTPVVPILLGLGVAITLLGVGIALAGVGVLAFSAGLTAISIAGAGAAIALVAIVSAMLGILPQVATALGLAVVAFAKVIAVSGPAITGAITAVLLAVINAIATLAPKIISTFVILIEDLLKAALALAPKIISTGLQLLLDFLQGIANNIGKVVTAGANIIVNFLNGVSANLPKIIDAGFKMIISFINGIADSIRENQQALNDAAVNLGKAIISGMTFGLLGGKSKVTGAAEDVAKAALSAANKALGINSPSKEFYKSGVFSAQGMVNGLDDMSGAVAKAAEGVGNDALDALGQTLSGVSDLMSSGIDLNPTITPVLDLSSIKKNSSQIGSLLAVKPISIDSSLASAKAASADISSNQDDLGTASDTPEGSGNTIYNQYNSSPKALSEVEIYRQTKNQLSVAKGALPKP